MVKRLILLYNLHTSKDMTKAEQDKHRILILELKNKIIRDYPSTKWIIQFGRVQDGGEFIKRSLKIFEVLSVFPVLLFAA